MHAPLLKPIAFAFFLTMLCPRGNATVTLPRLISDGLVLQRNKPVRVWGWADPGETVTVRMDGKSYTAHTDAARRWQLSLAPHAAGGPYELTVSGSNTLTVRNVLFGDVWICSGQSNMEYKLQRSRERYPDEIATAGNDKIRQFEVKGPYSFAPLSDARSDGWVAATPESVLQFTAVGYFFARELYERYQVPIGLINSAVGGTPAEAWISEEGLRPLPASYLEAYRYYQVPERLQAVEAANRRLDDSAGRKPKRLIPGYVILNHRPAVLYNALIAPLTNMTVSGFLWYQGEANTVDPLPYRQLLPALIADWRQQFNQGPLPFLYVQLANYGKKSDTPSTSNIAVIREAQALARSVPNTGMAVIHDAGETTNGNIHPTDKKTVGHRLALIARKQVYGEKDLLSSGPVFASMKKEGARIRIHFTQTGSGLVAKDGEPLRYFSIAGADQHFVWANARIEGNDVVVWSDAVPDPVAVRYAWAGNPAGANLYNREGLPASLFRTDNWNVVTAPNPAEQ